MIESIIHGKKIYVHSVEMDARFALGEIGSKTLAVFGVNPSTATIEKYDTTISKVIGYSKANGFDGWIMFNIYPQRSTDPDGLDRELNIDLHSNNIKTIKQAITDYQVRSALAAWGNLITHRPYFRSILTEIYNELKPADLDWQRIGSLTATGHPRHPSRGAYSLPFSSLESSYFL